MIGRVALVMSGLVLAAVGAVLLLREVPVSAFPDLAAWLALAVVIHDGVIGLVVALTGWALAQFVPKRYRSTTQAGVIITGVVAVMSVPVLLGKGRTAANPSLLPLDYHRNLAIVVGVVLVVTAVLAVVGGRRRSARERQEAAS